MYVFVPLIYAVLSRHVKSHPNIVRLYGYFHDEDEICLVLEYAGENDLHSILCYHQTFTEEETAHVRNGNMCMDS